jgi:arylsulfatase A-like enzyme
MRAIVFVLRGCPVGWLGAYGNEWVGTPNLDRVAAEGVVFDRHVSDRPDPDAAGAAWLGSPAPSLLDSLRTAGVRTVLVRANHPDTDGPDWFYAGWGEVFDARPREGDKSPLDTLIGSFPALLDRLADAPQFLLWVEIDRLLPPWVVKPDVFDAYFRDDEDEEPADEDEGPDAEEEEEEDEETDEPEADDIEELLPGETEFVDDEDDEDEEDEEESPEPEPAREPVPPWSDPPAGPFDNRDRAAWEWLHCSFAAVVTSLDAELGLLFGELRGRGLDQSAAWLITSDLGYPLGEHGQIGVHRPWLYEELVHLPLILHLPGGAEAGRRVPGFTQPPDIRPTLLDLFGLSTDAPSLLPLARGEGESHRASVVTQLETDDAAEAAIRTAEWAYLLPLRVPEGETREPQLYEKPDDRWEVNDLRTRNIGHADELEAELRTRTAEDEGNPEEQNRRR